MHVSLEEFEIQPDLTTDCGASEKHPHRPIMGKWFCHFFSAVLNWIHFIAADEDNIHESLDEFKIWPDPTTGLHGNR